MKLGYTGVIYTVVNVGDPYGVEIDEFRAVSREACVDYINSLPLHRRKKYKIEEGYQFASDDDAEIINDGDIPF